MGPSLLVALALGFQAPSPAPAPKTAQPTPVNPAAGRADYQDPIMAALSPQSGGLSSDEVASRAVQNAYELRAKQAQLRAAAAGLDQTMMQFVPQIKASAGYTRLSPTEGSFGSGAIVGAQTPGLIVAAPCDPALGIPAIANCLYDQDMNLVGAAEANFVNPLNQFSLQASLAVPLSDYALTLSAARKGSLAQVESAEFQRDAERLRVENDARLAYYNWLKAVAQVAATEQSLAHTRSRREDVQALFEGGLASKADVLRLDALVAGMQSAVEQGREFRDLAARQLAMIMGESGTHTPAYAVGEQLGEQTKEPLANEPLENLVERAWTQRLELKAMRASIHGVNYRIKASRANYFPRLDGFAEVTYANPNTRYFPLSERWRGSWSAGLSLTWVVNQALVTKSQVEGFKANHAELEASYAAAQRGVAMEVSSAYAQLRQAQAANAHQAAAKTSSEEAYRVAVDLFREGEATTSQIIDAEAERVNASLQSANAQIDLRVAEAKLRYSTGEASLATPADDATPSPSK